MDSYLRAQKANRITLQGALLNVFLLLAKFSAGIWGKSQAMLADAIHSTSDFITDIIVLVGVQFGKKSIDKDHPFGHGKFETLAAALVALFLGGVGVKLGYDGLTSCYRVLFTGEILPRPHWLAFVAAIVSVVAKEILYRVTKRIGTEIDSPALIANAWHHRSDAFSSIGTSIGTGVAVFLGSKWTILDPLAAAIVSIFILKAAWQILAGSLAELVESSVDAEKLARIASCVECVDGIYDPHNIRARKVGSRLVVDAHVRVLATASVKESHDRVGLIEENIRKEFGNDSIITIHVEPLPSYP